MTADAVRARGQLLGPQQAAAHGLAPAPGDITVDVAIIGAGYTGLATAYHLKLADPSLNVAVLEGETVGFGASGRNAGFVMTLFGASVGMMKSLHGGARVREAHEYMVRSIAGARGHDRRERIDCDYERSGFLKVATSPTLCRAHPDEIELFEELGVDGLQVARRG